MITEQRTCADDICRYSYSDASGESYTAGDKSDIHENKD